MTETVVKFRPEVVASTYRFDPDEVLEEAKGHLHTTLFILGENEAGELYMAGNANAGEMLVLMEKAKRQICFGNED